MAESSSVKVGWVIMPIVGVLIVVSSLLWVFSTESPTAADFTLFTGESWSDYVAANAKAADYLLVVNRFAGAVLLITGIYAIFLALVSYRKAKKKSPA